MAAEEEEEEEEQGKMTVDQTSSSPPKEHYHTERGHKTMTTGIDHRGAGGHYYKVHRGRMVAISLTIFLLLAGVTVLVVWLVYRPHRPHFTVVGAAIYEMNGTTASGSGSGSGISTAGAGAGVAVLTTMQFTVLVHNPNERVTLYYDRLTAFVSYRNEAITPPLPLPPLVQGHRNTVSMAPVLGGAAPVPVAPHVANGLMADQAYGVVALRLVFLGRLRYKAGAIKTSRYGLYVKCDMMIGLRTGFAGQSPLLGAPDCDVDV